MVNKNFRSAGPGRNPAYESCPFGQLGSLIRDSCELRRIWPRIRNLRKRSGHIGLVWKGSVDIWRQINCPFWVFGQVTVDLSKLPKRAELGPEILQHTRASPV